MTDRRSILLAGGTAALVALAGEASEPAVIRGIVTYEAGAALPKGELEVRLEVPARADAARVAAIVRLPSDGSRRALAFTLPLSSTAEPTEVVARLERADGWLLARGSAPAEPGAEIAVTLFPVMY